MSIKYGIIGSRRFQDWILIYNIMLKIKQEDPNNIIVSGGCKGPDEWAYNYAIKFGLKTIIFKADWKKKCHNNCQPIYKEGPYGKYFYYPHSGFNRNSKIAEESDIIYAFVVDETGGTWDTIKKALTINKPVYIAYPGENLKRIN